MPKAHSIERLRAGGAAFHPTWEQHSPQAISTGTITQEGIREQIGWINDSNFWKSFWLDFEKSKTHKMEMWSELDALQIYAESALAAASLAFFKTAPKKNRALLLQCMVRSDSIVDPLVMEWFNSIKTTMSTQEGRIIEFVEQSQRFKWSNLLWESIDKNEGSKGKLAHNRGEETGSYYAQLLSRAVNYYEFGIATQIQLLGHHFINTIPPRNDDFIATIVEYQKTIFDSRIDVSLVALCSGYRYEGASDIALAISKIGDAMSKKTSLAIADANALTAMLLTIHAVEKPVELYCSLYGTNLNATVTRSKQETTIDWALLMTDIS